MLVGRLVEGIFILALNCFISDNAENEITLNHFHDSATVYFILWKEILVLMHSLYI